MFLGSEVPIPGGNLVRHLDIALTWLDEAMKGVPLEEIYCLAWEGGNQDHDASQLVAAAFARRRGMLDRCRELPLYRAWIGRLFRVFSPLNGSKGWQVRRVSLRDGLRLSVLPWRYRSQLFSWLGLFPEAFVKLAIMRREVMRPVNPSRFLSRPHAGPLFYERRRRYDYDQFAAGATSFIQAHFGSPSSGRRSAFDF